MAFCEVSQDQSAGTPAAAGDFGFKVLTSADPAEKTKKLSAELANGRLAMMAIIGMFFQAGQGETGLIQPVVLLVLEDVLAHCELACHGGWSAASARRHMPTREVADTLHQLSWTGRLDGQRLG